MSRTTRRKLRTAHQTVRDGADQRPDRSCNNHGGCPWCERNRTMNLLRTKSAAAAAVIDAIQPRYGWDDL